MKRIFVLAALFMILISGCTDADLASHNLSKAADLDSVSYEITVGVD